ncbi:AraC family transcriptional regulator [Siphonobacter sp. SORGH_AS_1065]|uniref:AraC family transcriptional regulator n=1 Tax=Siphonobacter sp. SORGH_AS_1065 TaxID=3041795 RepID=UPI0027820317|nr:helix-turn-helix domain-containing protein [Siphonobacter sp. SORGH_AS_1065]MDQ1089681.1 AraC family transcriptional activator of pobA [Siphonobacter sp. SORGH_AS_1065]
MNPVFPTLGLDHFQENERNEVRLLDHLTHGKNTITVPHKHDFFLFFLVEESSGTHTIDFVDYPVANQQIHILLPGQVHHWQLADDTKGYQLMMSQALVQTFTDYLQFSPLLATPIIELDEKAYPLFRQEFDQLSAELLLALPDWTLIGLRCRIIARLISRELERNQAFPSKASPILVNYLQLLEENYKIEKLVTFYADRLHITPNYLTILCKKHLNLSAGELIHNRLLLEAKRLLQITDRSVKEISYELGFEDLAYFSNFFKKHTGISPRTFREQL